MAPFNKGMIHSPNVPVTSHQLLMSLMHQTKMKLLYLLAGSRLLPPAPQEHCGQLVRVCRAMCSDDCPVHRT